MWKSCWHIYSDAPFRPGSLRYNLHNESNCKFFNIKLNYFVGAEETRSNLYTLEMLLTHILHRIRKVKGYHPRPQRNDL